jgi:hypothetical protein
MDASLPIHPSIARDSRASSARSSFASLVRASFSRSPRRSTPPVTSFVQIGRHVFDSRVVRAARGRSSRSLAAFSEHFCSSGPTCLLIDRARAPMVFVGVTVPPEGETNRSERRPIRTFFESIRLLGFRSRGRSVSPLSIRSASTASRRSFLPWALPLAGLSATPGGHPVAACSRAGSSPHRVIASDPRLSRGPIRSWALRRRFPVERSSRRLPSR